MDTNDYDNFHLSGERALSTPSYFPHEYRPVQQDRTSLACTLGLPTSRKLFSYVHLAAVVTSLLCFVLGVLAISPTLKFAWHLRLDGQIIVIGFLIGVMNLCMQVVLPFAFLLLEERFGRSRLQNYEAILSGKFSGSHISLIWRFALLFLLALPLGLSVAYKRFLGGTISALYSQDYAGSYGIDFPRIGSWSPPNDPLYFYQTSFAPFQTASGLGNATYPRVEDFPLAYGYNTLLLSNDSAAILDMPTQSYLTHLQNGMLSSESLHINASVNAYMASYDESTTRIMSDDSLWTTIIKSGALNKMSGLSTMYLFDGKRDARIGVMPFNNNTQILFAMYYNSIVKDTISFHSSSDEETNVFRTRAQIYNISRIRCEGSWTLNKTSILLLGGSCDTTVSVDSSILQKEHMTPFPYDSLPAMAHTYWYYANGMDSVWLYATYVVSVVTMYWARGLYMLDHDQNTTYAPIEEVIISTRSSLSAEGLLYLVLATQPALTVLGFLITAFLYRAPIGKKFGLVSILSGIKPESLEIIQGAGLSGELDRPVKIDIKVHPTLANQRMRIQYSLGRDSKKGEMSYLKKGTMYL